MSRGKILVVDDDEGVRQLLGKCLAGRCCEVVCAASGEEAVDKAHAEKPDLIILDVDLPGMDGIETCQEIRKNLLCPIIFLSDRSGETDIVLGLGVGADHYITKPFRIAEMTAYVESCLRRELVYSKRKSSRSIIKIHDLTVDLGAHEVMLGQIPISLTRTEFKLLQVLVQNAGRVLSRDQLLDHVWELKADGVYSRTVDVHVGRVRRKLGDDPEEPRYIVTVPGLGYKIPSP